MKENKNTQSTTKEKAKTKPPRGETIFLVRGRGGEEGVAVGEHVRGKAGFGICDVLA